MNIPAVCVETKTDSQISFREKRCSITFMNPERKPCQCVQVDGCAITSGIRCDRLLIDWNATEHYVELKGGDIGHAIEQLQASIATLHTPNTEVRAYIIATNCSTRYNTARQVATKRMTQLYGKGFTLTVKTSHHQVHL